MIIRNVKAGSKIICESKPAISALGFWKVSAKALGLMPNATPNMMKAKIMFKTCEPEDEKLMRTLSRACNCSYINAFLGFWVTGEVGHCTTEGFL